MRHLELLVDSLTMHQVIHVLVEGVTTPTRLLRTVQSLPTWYLHECINSWLESEWKCKALFEGSRECAENMCTARHPLTHNINVLSALEGHAAQLFQDACTCRRLRKIAVFLFSAHEKLKCEMKVRRSLDMVNATLHRRWQSYMQRRSLIQAKVEAGVPPQKSFLQKRCLIDATIQVLIEWEMQITTRPLFEIQSAWSGVGLPVVASTCGYGRCSWRTDTRNEAIYLQDELPPVTNKTQRAAVVRMPRDSEWVVYVAVLPCLAKQFAAFSRSMRNNRSLQSLYSTVTRVPLVDNPMERTSFRVQHVVTAVCYAHSNRWRSMHTPDELQIVMAVKDQSHRKAGLNTRSIVLDGEWISWTLERDYVESLDLFALDDNCLHSLQKETIQNALNKRALVSAGSCPRKLVLHVNTNQGVSRNGMYNVLVCIRARCRFSHEVCITPNKQPRNYVRTTIRSSVAALKTQV